MPTRLLLLCILSASILFAQNQPRVRSWDEAEKLEAQSDAHPGDVDIHARLLRFYTFQSKEPAGRVKPLRRKHLLWLIENHPESSDLANSAGAMDASGSPHADPEGFAQCAAAWRRALSAPKPLFDAYANAVTFYRTANPVRARRIAENGLKRYPGNARISNRKGILIADAITGVKTVDQYGRVTAFDEAQAQSREAQRGRTTLESSDDTNLLEGAASALQQQLEPLHSRKMTARLQDIEALIVRLYQRADAIDPNFGRWKSRLVSAYRNFTLFSDAPAGKIQILEKALAVVPNAHARTTVLPDLAEQYLAAGDTAKAGEAAKELLSSDQNPSNPNYGYNVFTGNMLLGRVALKQGDTAEAGRRLVASGHAPGSPQLSATGPADWRLAEGLLSAGDRDSVLAYLDLLRAIWKNDNGRLASWISTIRAGGTPAFSPTAAAFPRDRYVGRPASDFRLKDLKGADVSLGDFTGKVVLVDFWATWCGPCRQEMPEFQNIHRAGKDVVVLALDVDEPIETVAAYVEKEKFTFPVLLAKDTDVMRRYSVSAYPTTFAIDKKGLVAEVLVGGAPDRLQVAIEQARAGALAPAPDSPPMPAVTSARGPAAPASSETAEDFYRDAVRQHNSKDYADAIRSLDRALDLRPNWLLAIVARADNHYHAKQYDEAIAGFDRAIQLDPKRAASYDGRGLAYSYSGRHAQAIPDYTRALDLLPNAAAYNNRGWAYLETDHLDEALADLNKALELNPANVAALFNRAHLFEKRSEYANAIADFDSVLHLQPANAQAAGQKAADMRHLQEQPAH